MWLTRTWTRTSKGPLTLLSSLLQKCRNERLLNGLQESKSGPKVTHLFFANDSILFAKANANESEIIRYVLSRYEESSGHCINFPKSALVFNANTKDRSKEEIKEVLGIGAITNLEKYLSLPSMVGREQRKAFREVKDRMHNQLTERNCQMLSQGGKEAFLKSKVQAIPTYTMGCFLLLRTLCVELNCIISNFWWRQNNDKRGIHWISWKQMYTPKKEGRLGFRDMEKFIKVILAKQGWKLLTNPTTLLYGIFKAKYFSRTSFLEAKLGSNPSLTLRSIWRTGH
ncbi:uncharacterized protein LOC111278011 [Durio zibethinus]|uniref:Uncharacterized protein LOC111278011 n=1 Tax=Durio zibethinus TaxID=66656 RepID=A0A6P5WXF1_DURZI|nr:uncharacterized protein LOC111278011 [Durio zibethinus]